MSDIVQNNSFQQSHELDQRDDEGFEDLIIESAFLTLILRSLLRARKELELVELYTNAMTDKESD